MKTLYDTDFNAWLDSQIALLRKKDFKHLDIKHLLEEMEDLGSSQKSALESHLIIILIHMLKQKWQPELSSKSWQDSIDNARVQIEQIKEDNPSLINYLSTVFDKCYKKSKKYASKQTRMNEKIFPEKCLWTLEEVLGD